MKKILLIILTIVPLTTFAQSDTETTQTPVQPVIQTVMQRFGYLSFSNIMESMPEYETAMKDLATLQAKYDEEAKRAEDEFNQKYIELLEGQKGFPENILRKRQAELEALMENNMKFRKDAEQIIERTRNTLLAPVKQKLNNALKAVGDKNGYAYILNTDNDTYPYINTNVGEDITAIIKQQLNCK